MTIIYKVISNVKHNGDEFKKDTFFQGNDGEFTQLVADGVLKAFDTDSIEEAQAIDAQETAIEVAETEDEVLPPNTWEAKKTEDEVIPTDDTANAPGDAVTPTSPEAKPTEEKKGFLGNLFGSKKAEDEKVDDKTGEVYSGPMIKVKFIKEYEVVDENNTKTGEVLAVGTEYEVPEPVVAGLVADGYAEEVKKDVDLENGNNL